MRFASSRLSVRRKLAFLPFLFFLGLLALQLANSYVDKRLRDEVVLKDLTSLVLNGHRNTLKAVVQGEASSLAEKLKTCKTKEEQVATIIAETDPIRFFEDRSGYFFTYDLDGVRVNVPINKAQNGHNLIAANDAKGFPYVAEFVKAAKAGGGFVNYDFEKPQKGVQPKLSFVAPIPGSQILIGAGVYIDNVAEDTALLEKGFLDKQKEYIRLAYEVFAAVVVISGLLIFWLGRSLGHSIHSLTDEMLAGSEQVAAVSSEVSSGSQSLAESAAEQAASLEETNASLEELASRTKENAGFIQKVSELGKQTRLAAEKGTRDMETMTTAVDGIRASSNEIAKIIKTIDEIAFQTNILALNAAVEAARAGESGMGFAVVAEEVRNLAQRSAAAARDTAEKIEDAVSKANQGAEISATVSHGLQQILDRAREVDNLAAQVSAASQAQTQGIDQVNSALGQMDTVTQTTAAAAEQSASAATELSAQAEGLKTIAARLYELVDGNHSPAPQAGAVSPR